MAQVRLCTSTVVTAMLISTAALQAQGTSVVTGTVRDETGAVVNEALVVIDPDSLSLRARSGSDGRFRIPDVPRGRYEVRVVRIGFRPHSMTVDLTGPELDLTIALRSVPIPLDTVAVRAARPGLHGLVVTRGISLLPHEPRALRGAQVEGINGPHRTRTGTDGRFSMPQLPAGSHGILVSSDGFATRVIPVTIPPDGGVEITVTLDSMYAEYQQWDEAQTRGIGWRTRRATSPASFISVHELDLEATDLRQGLRYSHSLLSRGLRIDSACIYLNGKPQPNLALQDLPPTDIEAIEVYPPNTLDDPNSLPPFIAPGTPCHGVMGGLPVQRGAAPGRIGRPPTRARGNGLVVMVIWTRGRK